jgi:hypothetical protein
MLRHIGCQCWSPWSKFWLNIGQYLESCKLTSILSKQQKFTILNLFFCFPNSLLVYVVSWFIGFLMILIKPKTLGVDFCAIEVDTNFLEIWGLLPLLWFWFYIIEVNKTFWFTLGSCCQFAWIWWHLCYHNICWTCAFEVTKTLSLFRVFDTNPLNMIASLEIGTRIKFNMNSRGDGHKEFVHFCSFKPLL